MENKKIGKVFSASIIYAITGILEKCFSFFLLPLYTRYLTTEDYGITDLSRTFLNVMIYIAAFSLFASVSRNYVEYKDEPEKLKRFYGTITSFVLLSCIVFFIVLTIFRKHLSEYVFSGVAYYPVILLTLTTLLFQCQFDIYSRILRSQQKANKVSVLHLIWFVFRIILTIYLVVIKRIGANGVLIATLAADMAYTLYFWIDMLSSGQMVICIDGKLLKEALLYSIPIMPHNLSTHFISLISKVLIGNASGTLSSLGVYSVASNFRTISDSIHNYINQAYSPWMFEQLHKNEIDYRLEIRNVVRLLVSVSVFLLTGIALFSQDYITLFLTKSYEQAKYYAVLLVIVYIIKTAYYFYVAILFYYKEASSKIFIATLSSSMVNLLLSVYLIPKWNVVGSIIADMIAMIIRVGIVVVMANKFDRIGLEIKDFIISYSISFFVIGLGMFPSLYLKLEGFHLLYFAYRVILMIIYFSILLFYNKTELKKYKLFSKIINKFNK